MSDVLCYFTEVRALVEAFVHCGICVTVRRVKQTACFTPAHKFNTEYSFLF